MTIGRYPGCPVYLRTPEGTLYNTALIASMNPSEDTLEVVFTGPEWPRARFTVPDADRAVDRLIIAVSRTSQDGGGVLEWSSHYGKWDHLYGGVVVESY